MVLGVLKILVLEEKTSLPRIAFENTTRRLVGEEVGFSELKSSVSKNPIRRIFNNFIDRTSK